MPNYSDTIDVSQVATLAPNNNPTSSPTRRIFAYQGTIPLQSNILWRIERGVVRTVTWNEEGLPIVLGYWGKGDVIGQPLSRVTPYQIECLTGVETAALPVEVWCQELDAIVLHIQQTEELLKITSIKPLPSRLWQLLLWLGEKFGRDVVAGRLIDLRLTHQELAEAISATRVSVTRMLQRFEQEGKLLRHQKQLILCQNHPSHSDWL